MPAVSKKTPSKREQREGGPLRSGELARISGVSADTLRHYERKGLLKPRRAPNGYREYPRQAVERVRLIRSRDQIRRHLKHIAKKFSEGDFAAPMLIHAKTPPGATAMQSLKAKIKYEFEELERGGRVRISTNTPEAVKAIHKFLRFQIKDHQTGDSGEIGN